MGKTLLKGRIRLRKPRRSIPCKRFCSCCCESGIKPFPPKKGGRSLPNKRKTVNAAKRASVKVKQSKNSRKSIALSQGCNVRARLKQLIVNVTRLSEDVLKVLLENGSICACNVSSDGVCKLSPSKAGTNSCLVTPTRRLRSTQIQPVVRQNVMDCMRELNADWRSTTCPSSVNLSSAAYNSVQEPGLSMKTLFLENLSIRKKTLDDESIKENVKMHQNENISSLGNPPQDSQQLKIPMASPSKVRMNTFPMKVKRQIHYTGYHSLLWDRNPAKFQSVRQQNLNSLLRTRLTSLSPAPSWKSGASVSGVPSTAMNPRCSLSGPRKNSSSTRPSPTALRENFSISKIESHKNLEVSNLSTHSFSKQKPQPTSSVDPQKSKTLVDSSRNLNVTHSAQKRTYAMRHSKNDPSASGQCKSLSLNHCSNGPSTSELKSPSVSVTKPRIIRGKRPLPMRPGCADPSQTVCTNVSKPVDKCLPQEKSRGSSVTEKSAKVDDPCGSSKKLKFASSETSESYKLIRFSNLSSGKREKSHVPPKNDERVHTIVLSDSSDEGLSVQKAASATPARKKGTPNRRSARDKSKRKAKAVLQKRKSAGPSNTPKAVKRVPQRKNSLLNRNPKNVLSDPESEELSSDSEVEAPRYLSRTGRSVGTWAGCRSCPGCKSDRPRKGNFKPKPGKRKRKPGPLLHDDGIGSQSDFFTDVVHAGSEEFVEDIHHALNSSPAVFIHGLTSSESSDDELLVLAGGRTALVVVPNEDAEEHKNSQSRSEVVEEVTSSLVHSPVLEPITASEGRESVPGDVLPSKSPESAHPNTIACTNQMLHGTGSLKGSPSAKNHVSQTPENSQGLSDVLAPAVIINDDIESNVAPCSQIPVNSKPHEAQNVKTDLETDGFPKSGQSEIQCYLSHHDSDGKLLLHEINSESSEEENNGREFQEGENNVSLKDDLSVSLLVDSSLETSDDSSALMNFDSQEYPECESTCHSQAGSVPEDLQEVNVPPEGRSSESFNEESPSLRDKPHDPGSFIEVDPPKREDFSKNSTISEDASKSPNRDGNPACVTQGGKVAGCHIEDDLASEHGSTPSSGPEICVNNQIRLTSEESSLGVPQPIHMETPQEDSTSTVRNSAFVDHIIDLDDTNKCQDSPPDTTSLVDSTHQGSAPLPDCGPDSLKTALQEKDSSLVLNTLHGIDVIDKMTACVRGTDDCQDSPLQEMIENISPDNCNFSLDDSAPPTGAVVGKLETSQRNSTIIPNVSNILLDSLGESDARSGTLLQNETSKATEQNCPINDGDCKVLEILMLEGCPSCREDCQDPSTYNQAPPEHSSSGDPSVGPLSPSQTFVGSANFGVRQKQEGTFYHTLSKVLVDCLNNMVESVKLDNREVIIKKVNPESPDHPETDPQETGLAADDAPSILKEFDPPVYLNPRLSIKKLPPVPRTASSTCEINSTSGDSASQGPPADDHQVPENARPIVNTTPTKSLYERKGYPTPIKNLDPRVLSVIKYNDLEIYNDEPSLNDPPKSDRVECVTSKGIRLELNPEELANIENLLNTKISQFREGGVKKISNMKSFELDELVIYNDEPSLNLTPAKSWKTHLPLIDNEDPEEFVIDNDAPPLNEPICDAPPRNEHLEADIVSEPRLDDTECMVISSDDEVVTNLPLKDAPKVGLTRQEASCKPSKLLERPRIKLFRKRRNSKNCDNTPRIIDLQTNQMAQRAEDPLDFGTRNLEKLELSELDCLGDDIIDEIVIDDSSVETIPQSSWKSMTSFQSYGEVLHQPQVFNHLGQPLLNLGSSGQFIGDNPTNPIASSSDENAIPTSQATFDLSEILHNSQEIECFNISDSDTMTASECGDEVIVVSPTKPSLSHVERFIEIQTKRRDKSVVQNVDTDSDDDVIVMSDPVEGRSVNSLFPSPAVTSPAHRIGLQAPGRKLPFLKTNPSPQIRRNPSEQITSSHVKTVQTPSGHSYLVLVVPPNTVPVSSRR